MSDLPVRDRVQAILTLAEAMWLPLPWEMGTPGRDGFTYVRAPSSRHQVLSNVQHSNAAYLVAACNAFPDVAAALLEALDTIDKAKTLHKDDGGGFCTACDENHLWPCPTWQALNGGNESGDDR